MNSGARPARRGRLSERSEARPTGRRATWRALAEASAKRGTAVSANKREENSYGN